VRAAEAETLAAVKGLAPALAVLEGPGTPSPPSGLPALRALAAALYGDRDPAAIMSKPLEHAVLPEEDHYVLNVALPFASREELRLEEVDEGIAVHLNGRKCVLDLPPEVPHTRAANWSYDGKTLRVILGR
jgi:arsenite-transporting ATPase